MELLELYYKRYIGTVEPSDYVEWASHNLHMDYLGVKKLASMDMKEKLNIFEIEKMFEDVMQSMQWEVPSKEQCLDYHMKELHSQLLLPALNAMLIVKKIYDCTIEHGLFEKQMDWQEISDVIDDFQHGDNYYGYTKEKVNEMIVAYARRLWKSYT